jgi:hypothetical protein
VAARRERWRRYWQGEREMRKRNWKDGKRTKEMRERDRAVEMWSHCHVDGEMTQTCVSNATSTKAIQENHFDMANGEVCCPFFKNRGHIMAGLRVKGVIQTMRKDEGVSQTLLFKSSTLAIVKK